jgi:hypothetical protein
MYLIHYTHGYVVMEFIIIAILAEISILIELLANFIHANVDGFVRWLDSMLKAERAVRQVFPLLPGGLLELDKLLLGILLIWCYGL